MYLNKDLRRTFVAFSLRAVMVQTSILLAKALIDKRVTMTHELTTAPDKYKYL